MPRKMKRLAPETAEPEVEHAGDSDNSADSDSDMGDAESGSDNVKHTLSDVDEDVTETEEADKVPAKKARLDKVDLYKAPTNEELNQLKQADNVFHSGLFRLQVGELLSEVKLKQARRKCINKFVKTLQDFMVNLPTRPAHELSDTSWLKKLKVKLPLVAVPASTKGTFQFHPPRSVKVMGSYSLNTCIKPKPVVDLAVEIPKECFQAKDHLNQRYFRKRAFYLAVLAKQLRSCEAVGDRCFSYHHGNTMMPVLIVKPKDGHGSEFTVHLHLHPEEGVFKLNRFHIDKNNIRRSWYKQNEPTTVPSILPDPCEEPATPHYNSWLLHDLTRDTNQGYAEHMLGEHASLRNGLILLKVWLRQRQLDQGTGSFSSHLMLMFVVYLCCKRKVNAMMSSYQVVRNTLLHLSRSDWCNEAITLATDLDCDPNRPLIADFHKVFDLVFIDKTGYVNLAADLFKVTWQRVQHEAVLSLQALDKGDESAFDHLFMSPVKFLNKFDMIFHIKVSDPVGLMKRLGVDDSEMDLCGNTSLAYIPSLAALLHKALACRSSLLGHLLSSPPQWPVISAPPILNDPVLTFGLLEDHDYSQSVLEKGPSADSPTAAEFREFWGDKSELRRFQDGSICEAAVWSCKTLADRRKISARIIKHVLHRHAGVRYEDITVVAGSMDQLLRLPQRDGSSLVYGTGEEQIQDIHRCYDELAKTLRNLKDLSLTIHTIQGISTVFRYAEVFPTMPSNANKGVKSDKLNIRLPNPEQRCPSWSDVIKVLCVLEASGKWPDDKDAVSRVKAAFLLKMRELLVRDHSLVCEVSASFLDVFMEGYVFRVEIGHMKEIGLLKMVTTPEGMVKMVNTEASSALEHRLVRLPQLTTMLHALQQMNNSYSGTVRLAKRWLSAHMLLDGCMLEGDIELMVAYLYMHPQPYSQPGSPQTGFLRFLSLLCAHDWNKSPLIVNLNQQLSAEESADMRARFTRDRATLPLVCICSPLDKLEHGGVRRLPTAQVLQRIVLLAHESLTLLHTDMATPGTPQDYKRVFRPPLTPYDVIIHLKPEQVPRHFHAVNLTQNTHIPTSKPYNKQTGHRCLPVTGYNPVQSYLAELRETYKEVAMFFCDTYGGSMIAVVWKPHAFTPHQFKVSRLAASQLKESATSSDTKVELIPDVEAVLEGFSVLGHGIVDHIDTNTDQWTI